MKVELRISDFHKFDETLKLDAEIIGIGDEFCPWKLYNINNLYNKIHEILSLGKSVRIVTSVIPANIFSRVVDLIEEIGKISEHMEFIINDYGFLSYVTEHKLLENHKIVIGQMLNHSLEEYLWSDEVVSEETDKVKNNWLLSNFASEEVLNYFKNCYRVKGTIVNQLPFAQRSADIIKSHGMEISFVDKYYTMAVARKCHTSMYHNLKPGVSCNFMCNHKLMGALEKIYTIADMSKKFVAPDQDIMDKTQNWTIYGNAIYMDYPEKHKFDKEKYKDDTIIINQRYYNTLEEVNEIISQYKN